MSSYELSTSDVSQLFPLGYRRVDPICGESWVAPFSCDVLYQSLGARIVGLHAKHDIKVIVEVHILDLISCDVAACGKTCEAVERVDEGGKRKGEWVSDFNGIHVHGEMMLGVCHLKRQGRYVHEDDDMKIIIV